MRIVLLHLHLDPAAAVDGGRALPGNVGNQRRAGDGGEGDRSASIEVEQASIAVAAGQRQNSLIA